MRIEHDNAQFQIAETNSSTLNSGSIRLDRVTAYSLVSTITDTTPSAKTFVSGLKEVTAITVPAENAVKEITNIVLPAENGVKEVNSITLPAASAITTGHYFVLNNALNAISYYVWYNKDAGGGDPLVAGKTALPVAIITGDTNAQVATKTAAAINAVSASFSCPAPGAAVIVVTNAKTGATTTASDGNVGGAWAVVKSTTGVTSVLNGKYFTINSALDAIAYYVWFSTSGTEGTDPAPAAKTGIKVSTVIGNTATQVATATSAAINAVSASFSCPDAGTTHSIVTNAKTGATTDAANVNVGSGFSLSVTTQGVTSVLNGKYFTIDTAIGYPTATIPYYVWFNTNSEGTDPAPAGRTAVPITTAIGDSANTVAIAVAAALDALAGFVVPVPGGAVATVTNFDAGLTTDAANVNVGTGFSISISTQGTATKVDLIHDYISITAHGFLVGLKVQASTSSSLPTGLSTVTDYFVIVVDANTIQLATSLANALAGTAIDLTTIGVGTQTLTATTTIAGTIVLQASNDNSLYFTISGSSQTISGAGSFFWNVADAAYKYVRIQQSITTGQSTANSYVTSKNNFNNK